MTNGQGHRLALPAGYTLHWYEIESILGQGGFGITYLARDTNLDQLVAIKEFLPTDLAVRTRDSSVHPLSDGHSDTYGWGLSRFVNEAKTLAKFRHPNIVLVHSVFEANETAYMVMEYVKGRTLEDALKFRKIQGESEFKRVMFALLDGLSLIHAAGFIHRDIKPDNIYLREDGTPVLLDFGSARQAVGEKTRTLTALVSPGYAPYEQYDSSRGGESKQGPWTDIYGLGATLYRAVTGKGPIDATARVNAILDGDDILIPAGELGKGSYSAEFLSAIDWALALRPKDRPQDIASWRKALTGELDTDALTKVPDAETIKAATRRSTATTRPGATRPVSRPATADKSTMGRRTAWEIAAIILLAVAGAGWWLATATDPLKPSEPAASVSPGAAPEQSVPAPAKREPVESPDTTPAQGMTAAVTPDTAEETAAADEARKAEQEAARQRLEQQRAEEQRMARIDELLKLADADFEAGRLTSPAGENALERYEGVLKADPGNVRATLRKQQIFTYFMELGTALIAEKNFPEAEKALLRAEAVDPGSAAVRLARVRLHDAKVEAENLARIEQRKKEEAERKAREEEQRLAEQEKKRLAEEERKRKEELARQQAEEERRRLEEARRKAEEEKLAELEKLKQEELQRTAEAENLKKEKLNLLMTIAKNAESNKDFDLAINNYNDVLKEFPNNTEAISGIERIQSVQKTCKAIIGAWKWNNGSKTRFYENGTVKSTAFIIKSEGIWKCVEPGKRIFTFNTWDNERTIIMTEDYKNIESIDAVLGTKITAKKLSDNPY